MTPENYDRARLILQSHNLDIKDIEADERERCAKEIENSTRRNMKEMAARIRRGNLEWGPRKQMPDEWRASRW